jgi:predicted dehydrogenase
VAGKLQALIIGAGDMARRHADAYAALPDVELAAVADPREEFTRRFASEYGIPNVFLDADEMLEKATGDIVSVCVPTTFHPRFACAAMERGFNVVSEKPIALTLEAADEMISASRKTGKKLTVIFNRRHNTVWHELQRRIHSIVGPMVYNAQEIRSIRPKPAMHSRSANGGPVIDCCVHDFDMVLQLFGRPVSIFATGHAFGGNKEFLSAITDIAIDTAQITVQFEGGNQAHMFYAWGFPVGSQYWQYREFMGPDGIVRLMGEFGQEVHHYRADGRREVVYDMVEDGHATIIREFVNAIRTDGEVPVRAEDAREALRLALAALQSIEEGRKIDL